MKHFILLFLFFCAARVQGFSQDSLVVKSLAGNKYIFNHSATSGFSGSGWDSVLFNANKSQYFLLGETHFINEVPLFIDAVTAQVKYQTFVAEIDPFLADIMQHKIQDLQDSKLQEWYRANGNSLTFFAFQKDFELLTNLTKKGVTTIGLDQITALNDVPVYYYLAEITKNKQRRKQYIKMGETAQTMLGEFLENSQANMPYMMSEQFKKDLSHLQNQKLTSREKDIIDKLEYSNRIYTSRDGHARRINLMKNQLMNQYAQHLHAKKALFRLGAVHSPKGESLLTIYDIGNMAHNLAGSQFATSYHIAIFPKAGQTGSPFKGKPNTEATQEKSLAPFYSLAADNTWTYFDLRPLRKQLQSNKLKIEDVKLKRFVEGYDAIIIVPEATAAEHI